MAFAAAIPALVGLGSSIFSGISGKGAAKKQQKLAEEQMAMLRPLIDAQVRGSQFAIDNSRDYFNMSKPYLKGAASGLQDLQGFWNPLMHGNRSAVDMFFAKDRDARARATQSASDRIAKYTGRGGGRVSGLMKLLSDNVGAASLEMGEARKQGAGELKDLAGMLGNLGQGVAGVGVSSLGAGLGGGQGAMSLLNGQLNRSMQANQAAGSGFKGLGGFLTDLFDSQGWGKNNGNRGPGEE